MKEKYVDFPGRDRDGNVFVEALRFVSGHEKTASIKTADLEPALREFIDRLKPVEGKLFVLVNALGAGEFWSANLNADWFGEDVLRNEDPANGYKTFFNAGIYRNHANKDIAKSFGRTVVAVYNPRMHRVELLLELDRAKAALEGHQDLIDDLDAGKNPCVSMGMRTPFDICSVCNHQSRTQTDRCEHILTQKNVTLPDGHLVCMINPVFKAFDLSFVTIGADNTSFSIAKIASLLGSLPTRVQSKTAAPRLTAVKTASNKYAEILKTVPAMAALQSREPAIPPQILNRLGSSPLHQSLASAGVLGIALRPREFQRVILISVGEGATADRLDRCDHCFTPRTAPSGCDMGGYSREDTTPSLLRALLPLMAQRSAYAPLLSSRLSTTPMSAAEKVAHVPPGESPLLDAVAGMYGAYRTDLITKVADFSRFASQDAEILSTMVPDELEMSLAGIAKTAGMPEKLTMLGVLPLTYLLTQTFKSEGEQGVVNFVKDHPVVTGSFLVGMLGMLAKR